MQVKAVFLATLFILAVALVYDIRFGRLPNRLTFSAMIAGIAFHSYINGAHGFILSLGGMLVGFGLFIGLYLLGGMGAGDVKLMAAVGALLGPKDVCYSALATAVAGGIYALALIFIYDFNRATLCRYRLMAKTLFTAGRFSYIPSEKKKPSLRYGIAIAAGTLIVLVRSYL